MLSRRDQGQTAVEYALMLVLIIIIVILFVLVVWPALQDALPQLRFLRAPTATPTP